MTGWDDTIRVLHVDDDSDFADLTATLLEREGDRFTVETATGASDGWDRLTGGDFDCVVSDYDMPGRNGIEFLKTVREAHPDIPFILFTGKGSEEVASDAISAGVTDYLQKGPGTDQYTVLANRIENAVERTRAQRERQRHLEAIETAQEGISILDADGNFIYVNEAYADLYGYDPGDMIGEHWELIYRDEDAREIREDILPVVEETGHWHGTTTGLRADGSTFVEDHNLAITDRGEFVCTVRDLTDHRAREEQLQTTTGRFEAIFEASNDAILILDPDRDVIVDANPRAEELLGYSREELVSSVAISDLHPDDMEQYREFLDGVRTEDGGRRADFRCVTKAGEPKDCEISVSPIDADDSQHVVATVRDVTERKQRKRMIEGLHDTAQALSRATTDERIADIVVTSMSEILDMRMNAVWFHDGDEDVLRPVAWTEQTTEVVGDVPAFRADESLAWGVFETGDVQQYDDVSAAPDAYNPDTPIRSEILLPLGDHGVIIVGATEVGAFDAIDVSLAETVAAYAETALDRIEREATLRAERETVERLFETSPVAITIVAPDGTIRRANDHAEEVLGLTRSEITDRTYDDPEWGIIDENGDPIPSEELPFERVRDTGEPVFDYEHGIEWPDGTRRWLSINATPLTTDGGDLEAVIAVTKDVTAQREHEREIERQNERLEEFASIVSHDLRNPLNVAQGRLELAREDCESAHLDDVAAALDRSQALIDDLLRLARGGNTATGLEAVDLAATVEDSWANVETADATLVIETERTIRADRGRLKQLLENLIRNAVEHGSTGSRPEADDAVEHGSTGSQAPPGDALEHGGEGVTVTVGDVAGGFYVADDGRGIPADERDDVFQAGYSTSAEGTGFGLSIVKQVVEAHDWEVRIAESTEGGARFEITGLQVASE
ncbi:MAG: PAS domain S-box protein [Haloferacaceae archaeon]